MRPIIKMSDSIKKTSRAGLARFVVIMSFLVSVAESLREANCE